MTASTKDTSTMLVIKPIRSKDKTSRSLAKLIEKGPVDKKTESLYRIVNEAKPEEENLTKSEVQVSCVRFSYPLLFDPILKNMA
jgi:hypothetical protein